jgi:hypothetical protein
MGRIKMIAKPEKQVSELNLLVQARPGRREQ